MSENKITFPVKLASNNPKSFGIADATEISGHRSVEALSELYAISDPVLSILKDGSDAIGQEWFVVSEDCKYRLDNWESRKSASGWTKLPKQELINTKQSVSEKDQPNGYAGLDSNGKLPIEKTYGDTATVVEVETYELLPVAGLSGVIYYVSSTSAQYKWSGSAYIDITEGADNAKKNETSIFDCSNGTSTKYYASLSTAINVVPPVYRTSNRIISYLSTENATTTALNYQYNGIDSTTWTDLTKWEHIPNQADLADIRSMLLPYTKINVSKLVTINALYTNNGSIVQTPDWNYLIIPVTYGNAYKLSGIPSQCFIKYTGLLQSIGGACSDWKEQSDGIKELCIFIDDTSINYIVFNIVTNATLSDFANITIEGTNKDSIYLNNGLLGNTVNITEEKIFPNAVYNDSGTISSSSDWYYIIIPVSYGFKYRVINLPSLCTVDYTGLVDSIGNACVDWKYWHKSDVSVAVTKADINYLVIDINKNGSSVSLSDFSNIEILKTPINNNLREFAVTFDDFVNEGLLNNDGTINTDYDTCKVSRYYPLLGVSKISILRSSVAEGYGMAAAILYDNSGTILATFAGSGLIDINLLNYPNATFIRFSGGNKVICKFSIDDSISWYKSYEDFKFGYGLLREDGTMVTDYTTCFVSDYILLNGNEIFYLANGSVKDGWNLYTAIIFDKDKQVLGTIAGTLSIIDISNYSNARYIKFASDCNFIVAYKDYLFNPKIFEHGTLSWNAVGDSITEGGQGTFFSHPEEDMCMLFPQLKLSLNFQIANNCGKGGTTIAINPSSAEHGYSFVERVCGLNGASAYDDAAVWTIMGGVNDANYDSTLGTIDSTTSDTNTVYGSLKAIIENIQSRPNNPKLLFIIPPYMNYGREWNETMLTKYKNICDAMIEVCELYNIPYLNLYKTSGYNYNTILKYTYDGIHPNVLGVQMIKDRIVNFINENI